MVSVITAWGVRWTGLPHSPKTDSDRLIKDNRETMNLMKLDEALIRWETKMHWAKKEVLKV